MIDSPLHRLSALGQSVWLDSLSRDAIRSGELERTLRRDAVVGVTSNPTIFQKAMTHGGAYDAQLSELLEREPDSKKILYALMSRDVSDACDLLLATWQESGGRDGYVSWEVDPRLADDAEATIDEARRLHELVARPNLLVKIPATDEGVAAIEATIAAGRSVNVTLVFGLQRHREVAEAYLRGIERLVDAEGDPSRVVSVASFFVSRVDTEADQRLERLGRTDLQGRLAIANAKLAYQQYRSIFAGRRWEALQARGAVAQRCLWASTSTKNPAYRDVRYVEELIGPDTVDTMPPETIAAFRDHGRVRRTLDRDVEGARATLRSVEAAGISYEDLTTTLEREGVERFAASMRELLAEIVAKRDAMAGAHP